MKIVIDIDENDYELALRNDYSTIYKGAYIAEAIKNGTPLPRHHGRLIDYDDLIENLDRYGRENVKYQLPYSPTIIFADKEVNANGDSN